MALLWTDDFNRPDATGVAAVNNGWAVNGGDLNIVSNTLVRTGSGYCISFNPTSVSLPTDLRLEADVILDGGEGATARFFGIAVNYDDTTGDGVKVLLEDWDAAAASEINIGSSAGPFDSEPVTLHVTLPVAGWAADGTHILALEVIGSLCSVYFDGVLVADATYTPATPGANIALVGDPSQEEFGIDAVRVYSLAADITGTLAIVLPVPEASFDAQAQTAGVLDVVLPVPDMLLDAEVTASGVLDVVLPIPAVDLLAEASAGGSLGIVLPVPSVNLDGNVPASGVLNIVLPVPDVAFTGNSAAGGTIMGPCGWNIPEPLCPSDAWTAASPALKSAARDYAALILWAATGKQLGLCEISVRPCGMEPCGGDQWNFWGTSWNAGTWTPYLFAGSWYNCRCPNVCCCEPRCQVRLMGDVAEIVEVTIGGIAVDPTTYRVDDGHWLVRLGGECWPECSDLDNDTGDNVFIVTYLRGSPVPPALLNAAATLADEWVRGCTGGDCRLSNRVTSISRSGIDISMMNPADLLDNNQTGLWEVDAVINALNPYQRKQRGRIYAPELNVPRFPNP